MAPSVKDLQLTSPRRHKKPVFSIGEDEDELENVGLLDDYDEESGKEGQGLFNPNPNAKRIHVSVTGMTCAACSNSVESALLAVNGVLKASVALLQNKADVIFDPDLVKDEDIKNAIEDAGFEAEILSEPTTSSSKPSKTMSGQFNIGGITCAACVNSVEGILRELPGVTRAVVALTTNLGEVEYDPIVISKDDIVNAIEDAGFEASLVQSSEQDKILVEVNGVSGEIDAQSLESLLSQIKGVRQFRFDRASRELDVCFDPEVITSRSLVDGVEDASGGRYKLRVKSPFVRMTSKDSEESSKMFHLFTSSLFLSMQNIFKRCVMEMRMLRWICGNTKRDKVRNEVNRGKLGVALWKRKCENLLLWFGHVKRRPDGLPVRRLEAWATTGGYEAEGDLNRHGWV